MQIVLIEDEPDCFESYQVLLESRGHKVTLYQEADSVVENLSSVCKADVIILDLMIQLGKKIAANEATETGTALYKRIRKESTAVPVVVLTARSRSDIWGDFDKDARAKYLGKPVSDLDSFYRAAEEWK